ncbi:MAG: hypothetical protein FH753_18060 [Firmicutes bacterium]|nr:hypothetical protein [Bacillota bacterium]
MKDKNSLENIMQVIKSIEDNNWDNLDLANGVDMMLISNNNGTSKDKILTEQFDELRDKLEETINATNEFLSTLNDDDYE